MYCIDWSKCGTCVSVYEPIYLTHRLQSDMIQCVYLCFTFAVETWKFWMCFSSGKMFPWFRSFTEKLNCPKVIFFNKITNYTSGEVIYVLKHYFNEGEFYKILKTWIMFLVVNPVFYPKCFWNKTLCMCVAQLNYSCSTYYALNSNMWNIVLNIGTWTVLWQLFQRK